MKQTIILRTDQLKNRAAVIIGSLPLDPLHEIIIREHKRNRSQEQNQFYWVIVTIIAGELGFTKEELAEDFKRRFLVPIFERDNPEYAETINAVRSVFKAGLEADANKLEKQVVRLTSTTQATVLQMSEYLNDIVGVANDLGIRLPVMDY